MILFVLVVDGRYLPGYYSCPGSWTDLYIYISLNCINNYNSVQIANYVPGKALKNYCEI